MFIVQGELELHPMALIMPPMADDVYQKFKEDISGNGLHEPIVLINGKVLDGKERYRACRELGIDICAYEWEGGMDPVEYVVLKNIHRRQLSPSQRALMAAKAMTWHTDQAKAKVKAEQTPAAGQLPLL